VRYKEYINHLEYIQIIKIKLKQNPNEIKNKEG